MPIGHLNTAMCCIKGRRRRGEEAEGEPIHRAARMMGTFAHPRVAPKGEWVVYVTELWKWLV